MYKRSINNNNNNNNRFTNDTIDPEEIYKIDLEITIILIFSVLIIICMLSLIIEKCCKKYGYNSKRRFIAKEYNEIKDNYQNNNNSDNNKSEDTII